MAELNQQDMESKTEGGRRTRGMDMGYVKSINGVLKGKQIGWTFLAFVMTWFCGLAATPILFAIVLCVGLLSTIAIFVVFAFSLKPSKIDFYLVDFLLSIIATVTYFALSLPMIILSGGAPLFILAGIFGLLAMLGFAGNVWFSFKRWRASSTRNASNNEPNTN